MPREAETTRREGDESREETERRRLVDWPIANEADRCCMLLGRAEAEAAIAARGEQERTGALTKGEVAREAILVYWSEIRRRRFKEGEKERRKK